MTAEGLNEALCLCKFLSEASTNSRVPQRDEDAVLKKMLGADIRSVRNARGLTLEDLAERTGLHRTTIQKIESGEHEPRARTLMSLAKGLDVKPGDLMNRDAWDHYNS